MNRDMAKRISDLLQAKNGGNQSELARYVGVSPQAVQQWISGETSPRGLFHFEQAKLVDSYKILLTCLKLAL